MKAYDLGLIDALGSTEARAVRELLREATAQARDPAEAREFGGAVCPAACLHGLLL